MPFAFDTGSALVCSTRSRDVLKLTLDIDEDGVIEKINYRHFGPFDSEQVVDSINMIVGLSIEDAAEHECDDFIRSEKDVHLGIMMVNAIRLAVMNYVTKIQKEGDEEEESQQKVLV